MRIGAVVEGGPVQVVERGALRVAQVVQDGAGGADRGGPVGQPAAIEREQLEVIAQRAVGVIVGEDPVFELGADEARGRRFSPVSSGRSPGKSTSRAPRCSSAPATSAGVHFGDAELAGGDVHVGHAGALPSRATAAR